MPLTAGFGSSIGHTTPGDAGFDYGVGAGWGNALKPVRLQCADQRAAARRVTRVEQSIRLGVVARSGLCTTLSNDRAVLDDDRANGRPRRNAAGGLSGQIYGSSQEWIGHWQQVPVRITMALSRPHEGDAIGAFLVGWKVHMSGRTHLRPPTMDTGFRR